MRPILAIGQSFELNAHLSTSRRDVVDPERPPWDRPPEGKQKHSAANWRSKRFLTVWRNSLPRRRSRHRVTLLLALLGLTAAVLAWVLGLPHLQVRFYPYYEVSELYVPRMIDVVVVLWCLWVGSSIGSFLNVVAWRMPRGQSIGGRSRCPYCDVKISAKDNFPIFGWLAIDGRCRSCQVPISKRYPIVEAIVGVTMTAVAVGELYRLCLPRQPYSWRGGPLGTFVDSAPVLITLIYHIIGLSLSWAVGLIRMDGHRLPSRLVAFAAMALCLPMLVYPKLMVVPWQMQVPIDWQPDGLYIDAMVRLFTALAAATVLARYLARGFCPEADPKLDPLGKSTARLMDLVVVLSIPTLVVGWQAAPAMVVVASIIAKLLRRFLPQDCDALGRFALSIPLALTLQLLFWRKLHAHHFDDVETLSLWPSDGGSPWVVLFWSGIVMLIPLWLNDRPHSPAPVRPEIEPIDDSEDDDFEDDSDDLHPSDRQSNQTGEVTQEPVDNGNTSIQND